MRLEGFNLFNHGNFLGRGVTTYGDGTASAPTFGQFVGGVGSTTNAIPAFANIDPADVPTAGTIYLLTLFGVRWPDTALVKRDLPSRPRMNIGNEQ
jgi:hypothetical protein